MEHPASWMSLENKYRPWRNPFISISKDLFFACQPNQRKKGPVKTELVLFVHIKRQSEITLKHLNSLKSNNFSKNKVFAQHKHL